MFTCAIQKLGQQKQKCVKPTGAFLLFRILVLVQTHVPLKVEAMQKPHLRFPVKTRKD